MLVGRRIVAVGQTVILAGIISISGGDAARGDKQHD